MRRLQCSLLSTVAVIGFASIASAADLPVKAPVSAPAAVSDPNNWTGFYVGLNAGGAWGRSRNDTSLDCSPSNGYICNASSGGTANAAAVNASGSGSITDSGFTGGIQAGYNWQINYLVYGLETDFGALKLNGSRQASGLYGAGSPFVGAGNSYTVGSSFETDWLFTFRGRFGFALPSNLLAYVTGGLALTRIGINNSFRDSVGGVETASGSGQKTGWTVGGGLEWAISKHWTVKGEYLYLNFGQVTTSGIIRVGAYAQGISTSADLTAQVARLGVNYKF